MEDQASWGKESLGNGLPGMGFRPGKERLLEVPPRV